MFSAIHPTFNLKPLRATPALYSLSPTLSPIAFGEVKSEE